MFGRRPPPAADGPSPRGWKRRAPRARYYYLNKMPAHALALTLTALLGVTAAQAPAPCAATPADAPWANCTLQLAPLYGPIPATGVNFTTADAALQALFSHAEVCEAGNILPFAPGFDVLVEGGHYKNIWLETQPMGGAMYGVRNLTVALHNQLAFMRTQRLDGRLAGMVTTLGGGAVNPTYSYPGDATRSMLQGFYMASPAVDVAFLLAASGSAAPVVAAFLSELQPVLARFDAWLWAARNSSRGVLWLNGTADTGEDGSDKYRSTPANPLAPPFESMDMMAYAHDAQRALARIAAAQGDAAGARHWAARMAATAAALKARLWRAELGACFDRERDGAGAFVSTLLHNNLRAMWAGTFDQAMADAFVARHLMNASEFWTRAPLPSISAADARFENVEGNNWSGPAEGLTYQRAIRALEGYGHHAEVVMAGALQRAALLRTGTFPQQINPLTAQPDAGDCYGPQLLALLEFTALTTGVAVRAEPAAVLFSSVAAAGAAAAPAFSFAQRLGGVEFALASAGNGTFSGTRNGAPLFTCEGSVRVVAGLDGVVTGVVGASAAVQAARLWLPGAPAPLALVVAPNEEWAIDGGAPPVLARKVPFTPPFN